MGLLGKLFGRRKTKWRTLLEDDLTFTAVIEVLLEAGEYVILNGKHSPALGLALARQYPNREILASEPKPETWLEASNKADKIKNLYLFNQTPTELLQTIGREKQYLFRREVIVILHVEGGDATRRLLAEATFSARYFRSGWLIIVGCTEPGSREYSTCNLKGQPCTIDVLRPAFKGTNHAIYTPNPASPLPHRLRTPGWTLIALGDNAASPLPDALAPYVAEATGPAESDTSNTSDQ